MRTKYRQEFNSHKQRARCVGIPFLFSFETWLQVWKDSGRLKQRGRRSHEYVMARFGDKGAYEVGNVKIITAKENCSECHLGKEHSALHRSRIAAANTGAKRSAAARRNMSLAARGKVISSEHRKKLSESLKKGMTPARKAKMSDRQKGSKNSRYGIKMSKALKAKIGAAQRARFARIRAASENIHV